MTKLRIIWLNVFYQLRLALAEKLIDIVLSIMPSGNERTHFAIESLSYFYFVKTEIWKIKRKG